MEIEKFVKVPKGIFNLGSTETYIYSIIGKESLVDGVATVFMPQMLERLDLVNRTENMKKIKHALTNLTESLGIELYSDFRLTKLVSMKNLKNSQHYYIKIPEVNNYFVQLYLKDFENMMSMDVSVSKVAILLQYLFIVGRVNESGNVKKISYPTIEQISDAIGINRKTVMKYNQILFEFELIYYKTVFVNEKSLNIYSRWSDQGDVLETCTEVREKGRFFKERKTEVGATSVKVSQSSTKDPKQKAVIHNVDPSIFTSLEFFTNAGLAVHKGTLAKVNEATEICGVEDIVIVINDLKSICRNSMAENQWAGYFSNNIIAKAHHRKAEVETQKKANEKLDKEPNISFDYKENLIEIQRHKKEIEKEKEKEKESNWLMDDLFKILEEKDPSENCLDGLGLN